MTKPADTDITTEKKQDTSGDVIGNKPEAAIADNASTAAADKAPADKTPAETASAGKSRGGRNFILIVLLVAAAVLGSLALSGKLVPLYQSLTSMLQTTYVQQHAPEKKKVVVAKAAVTHVVKKPVVTSQPVPISPVQAKPRISSEEVQALLSSIDVLRGELQHMSDAQQTLQNGLKEQQQMNLQVRLRWIADQASRLPQLQLAWEEISLLPGLSDAQRNEAVRMHALARSRVQHLKQWQDALNTWADALATPVHRNILPEPEYPWLAWIVKQFQLRQAPSIEAQHLGDLRARLLDSARHLTLESWPPKGAWQSLQAELLLQIRAMHHQAGDENADAVETGLPKNFDAIQADITTLRQTALQWQQEGGR
jgi:hypothetical protein